MAHDEGLAEILRGDLADLPGISEKRMFGGLAFMLDGNMLCGVHKDGAMFRVGKAHEAEVDETRRGQLMQLALAFVRSLPPK